MNCFLALMDSGDKERETPFGGLTVFFTSKTLLYFPPDSFPPSPYLSVSQGALCHISLLHELSFLHYAVSISSPFSPFSLPALLLSLFSSAYISSLSLGSLFK